MACRELEASVISLLPRARSGSLTLGAHRALVEDASTKVTMEKVGTQQLVAEVQIQLVTREVADLSPRLAGPAFPVWCGGACFKVIVLLTYFFL